MFLIHGINGNFTEHYWLEQKFQNEFRKKHQLEDKNFIVYLAKANSCKFIRHPFNTTDGIINGGNRLLEELLE